MGFFYNEFQLGQLIELVLELVKDESPGDLVFSLGFLNDFLREIVENGDAFHHTTSLGNILEHRIFNFFAILPCSMGSSNRNQKMHFAEGNLL
jgi:hypothetical protein